jgi:glycosyltransferase involved in cell wall biosynthesis
MMPPESRPLVSIVIPCYNQARFLAEAIQSVLVQRYAPIETIVVDDGSTDELGQVLGWYPSVHAIRQPNSGAPHARNAGFRKSRGELVLFLDADDRLLPHAVSRAVDALAEHPEWAFVTGHVHLIGAGGEPEATPPQDHYVGDQFIALLRSNYIWTPGVVLYRRSVLESTGGFDPAAGPSADFELNVRIARQFPIGCHHDVVLEHRRHETNMSGDLAGMLRSAVSVRRAQRKHLAGNPEAQAAWKEGLDVVRADFGGRLLERVKRDLRTRGRRRRALTGALRVLRYYPAGLLRTLARGAGLPTSSRRCRQV